MPMQLVVTMSTDVPCQPPGTTHGARFRLDEVITEAMELRKAVSMRDILSSNDQDVPSRLTKLRPELLQQEPRLS